MPTVSLISYRLRKLLLEEVEPGKAEPSVTLEAGISPGTEESKVYTLRLRVVTAPPRGNAHASVPMVDAVLDGRFRVNVEGSDEEVHKALRVYGGAQLYSLLRGITAAPAAMFANCTTILPTINMQQVMENAKTKKPRKKSPAK